MARKKTSELNDNEFDVDTFEKVNPDTFAVGEGTYKISLPFLPEMEVLATSSEEACELYNKFTGVLSTVNRHEVVKVK
jgi:hypothetical protein